MVLEPVQGLLELGPGGLGVGAEDVVDLPVPLAVDADLGAAVVRLEDGDHRVAPGHQVDRGGVPFPHEVQAALPFLVLMTLLT